MATKIYLRRKVSPKKKTTKNTKKFFPITDKLPYRALAYIQTGLYERLTN